MLTWAWHPKALPTAVPASAALAAAQLGMEIVIARPAGFELDPEDTALIRQLARRHGAIVHIIDDPDDALVGRRRGLREVVGLGEALRPPRGGGGAARGPPRLAADGRAPQVDPRREGIVMHCLPVRRNVEIDDACSTDRTRWWWTRRRTGCTRSGRCCWSSSGARTSTDHDSITDPTKGIAGLKGALRYVRAYRDHVFVVKLGGDVLTDPDALDDVAAQLALLPSLGIRLVVVHGGGPQATALSRRLGTEPIIVAGRRVTDDAGARGRQDGLCRPAQHRPAGGAAGAPAPGGGLSGVDADLLTAHRRPPVNVVDDAGMKRRSTTATWATSTGSIPRVLNTLLDARFVPVVASLAGDDDGNVYNVNADTVAESLAVALQAQKLIFLTGAPGRAARPERSRRRS